ncbi:MAG: hypothetical protein LC689_07105 [Myxococcales bacterium]|nr:hypothetical protein [Myxococcales bacterium]
MTPDDVKWDDRGLAPAIVQDALSGEVLMLAWMNRESLARTLESGKATFWSRTRNELWEKGATSGNILSITSVNLDCDRDAILVRANRQGGRAESRRDARRAAKGPARAQAQSSRGLVHRQALRRRFAPPQEGR